MSNCKYYRIRKHNNKREKRIYFYCSLSKKEITCSDCSHCPLKDYKKYKTLKGYSYKQVKNERNRSSIIYTDLSHCCECGIKSQTYDKRINMYTSVQKNEVFEGSYRQASIKLGAIVPFCNFCHQKFHNDIIFNLEYKILFQKEYMKQYTLNEFIELFGQNYIYKLQKIKKNQ